MIRTLVYIWSVLVFVAVALITRKPLETIEDFEGQTMMTAETD